MDQNVSDIGVSDVMFETVFVLLSKMLGTRCLMLCRARGSRRSAFFRTASVLEETYPEDTVMCV